LLLTENQAKFDEKNVSVLAIARDPPKKLKHFKHSHNFSMPIIGDMAENIVKSYKVYTTGNMVDHAFLKFKLAIPTTYLIDTNGIIKWRYVGTREDRPDISQIFQAIEENLQGLNKTKDPSSHERLPKNSKPLVF
jgi:peroxiredoxin